MLTSKNKNHNHKAIPVMFLSTAIDLFWWSLNYNNMQNELGKTQVFGKNLCLAICFRRRLHYSNLEFLCGGWIFLLLWNVISVNRINPNESPYHDWNGHWKVHEISWTFANPTCVNSTLVIFIASLPQQVTKFPLKSISALSWLYGAYFHHISYIFMKSHELFQLSNPNLAKSHAGIVAVHKG